MAEKLRKTQPTSSIANALNTEAVQAATRPVSPSVQPPSSPVVSFPAGGRDAVQGVRPAPAEERPLQARAPTGEDASIVRHFQLTASADATLKQLIDTYSKATGLELTMSEFLRAMFWALAPTMELHRREATTIGPLRRTRNEKWFFHKRDELEQAIARAFTAAMRAAPRME